MEVEAGAVVSVVGVEVGSGFDAGAGTGVSTAADGVEGEVQALKKTIAIDSTNSDILNFIRRPSNL